MSDLEELLNCGLLSDENGISSETRALLTSDNFSQVVNYKEDTFIVTQGSEPDALYFTLSGIFHAISHANPQSPQRLLALFASCWRSLADYRIFYYRSN